MTAADESWRGGKAASTDPKLRLMRSAKTRVNYSHGMGGLPRRKAAKPVTLPKLKCLETKEGKP
jgi:hypothetical protein